MEQTRKLLRAMLDAQPEEFDRDRACELSEDPDALSRFLTEASVTEAEAVVWHHERFMLAAWEYSLLKEDIHPDCDRGEVDASFLFLMTKWFRRKFVVIEDVNATGEEILSRIVAETPPGCRNRVMGMQNIKGTGLDFVYRWQAWETCHAACQAAVSAEPSKRSGGIGTLMSFRQFGILSEETVRSTLARLRTDRDRLDETTSDQLDLIERNLNQQLERIRASASGGQGSRGAAMLVKITKQVLDPADSIRRRRRADRIYKDLDYERISHQRAGSTRVRKRLAEPGRSFFKAARRTARANAAGTPAAGSAPSGHLTRFSRAEL